jgi:amino-acid N-acetyltransferase
MKTRRSPPPGSTRSPIRRKVLAAMQEVGVDLSDTEPRFLSDELARSEVVTGLTIDWATAADVSEIVALLERCQLPTVGVAENVQAFAVARSEGVVVGSSGVETYASCGLLRSVAVDASKRSCGVGATLVAHAVARASEQDLIALYLLTTSARAYFERHAFAVCPRHEAPPGVRESWEFRSGCPDTAVFMRRAIR